MIEEIDRNLYRLEIPLPQNPLKSINSYVIKSPLRNLVIDTGLNREECRKALQQGLETLHVDLAQTDFFITHLHADHLALATTMAHDTARIYLSEADAARTAIFQKRTGFEQFARLHGMPEDEVKEGLDNHPGVKYGISRLPRFRTCRDGDTIEVGEYVFSCVETPGHSFGHVCLYEPTKQYLVSGDHILRDITPNIQSWSEDWNPLVVYLASLEKIKGFDVKLVLPGHRGIFRDCRARIEELKQHHETRAREVLTILSDGGKTAYEVASKMSWDIVCDSWEQFPVTQKWFAVGEAIAHLMYLEALTRIEREVTGGHVLFRLRPDQSD
jgi:glyoxylase-like metal-dependent hydrolase (beta-lactamase superfamily II)